MSMLKILKKLFFLIVAMLSLATAGLGAVCSNPAGQYTFTTSGSYTDSYSGRNFDSGDDVYYNFTIESAGTLKFTRVADNDVSYTYGLATCPTSGGTALNNNDVISFTGPTTLSIRIHSSRNNQGYNFTLVFTAPPKINITSTVSDTEGNSGPKTFTTTVTLSYASASTVTVNYATANETATTSNNDYVAKSGILTFTPGQTSKTIDIIVNGDIAIEPDELFYVNLSGQSGATLQTTQTVITITNDDFPQAPPVMGNIPNQTIQTGTPYLLKLSDYVTDVNNDPILSYSLTSPSGVTLVLSYLGLTFDSTTGILSGTPTTGGTYTFTAKATDDDGDSNPDDFTLTIPMPTISISDANIFEGPNGSERTMVFTVTITPSGSGTIDYNTSNITATAGADYQAKSGTITFVAGEITTREISIKIYGDANTAEGTETFRITLSNPVGLTISDGTGIGTIYDYGSTIFRSGEREFELRNPQSTRNKTGDITVVGNSVQCVTTSGSAFNAACTTVLNDTANNKYTKYLNSDSNTSTFNSANAVLAGVPSGAKVIWAGLYWEGFMHKCDSTNSSSCRYNTSVSSDDLNLATTSYNTQKVLIDIPNNSVDGYEEVTASLLDYRYVSAASGTVYSAFIEITEMLNKTNANGTYTVANIQSMEGLRGYGNFGAWSLFIIYEDLSPTSILRNMSVYDGFKTVTSSNGGARIDLSGFMTPTQGVVDSKLISFAGEGENAYSPDRISVSGDTNYVSNAVNPENNVFNSTIAGFTRNPSWANANGIDIDTFDISGFMGNGQTATTIKMTTSLDAYYPSVVGFSTQLYAPDVCYLEEYSYNGSPVSESNTPANGDDIDFTITVTNLDNEPAQGVFIEKEFRNPTEQLAYKPGSMSIRPIGSTSFTAKTDSFNDDTAEYDSTNGIAKLLLGFGASASIGGTINKDQETQFKYTATIGSDENITENIYLVSYRNDYLRISFQGIPIRKCVAFDNSFGAYTPILGKYNTVHSGAVNVNTEQDPEDPNNVKNALYSQVVGLNFSVDVIAFANDNITPTTATEDLNLSIVELPMSGICTEANVTLSSSTPLHFANEKMKSTTVIPLKASKNAVFKMVTSNTSLCSRDRFAIRPASFSMDANDTTLIGNKVYQFTFMADGSSGVGTPSVNYNQEIHNSGDKNATTQLLLPAGCTLANPAEYINTPLPFSEGQVSALVLYPNVGDINLTITDNQWTVVDSNNSKGDCILNSNSNIHDGNGKVGCMAKSSQTFQFLPETFTSTLSLINADAGAAYTYVANEQNMSAILALNTTATLIGGAPATNYTANCFAKNITTTVDLTNNKPLSWGTSQARVKFFDDLNATSSLLNQAGAQANFSTTEGNFTNGSGAVTFKFNFDRNISISDNPFTIAKNDFNITVVDTTGTTGNDFNRTNDMNATFLYGKTHVPRQRFSSDANQIAVMNYEVYCSATGCKNLLPAGVVNFSDDPRWLINTHHMPTSGNPGPVFQKGANLISTVTQPTGTHPDSATLTYNGSKGHPYKATMENNASSWLIYNPYNSLASSNEFDVEFEGAGSSWAGVHETNTTTNQNASTKTNRRSMW